MRVLIAEDEPVSRKRLELLLNRWGYETIAVADGNEAWKVLSGKNPPRLAILDWMMPGLDGVTLCRNVRELREEPYIYVLLLTAKDEEESLVEAMGAGADDFLSKPFKPHELEVRLRAGKRIGELQEDLIRAREALREQATHDALTGCWNRRAMLEILNRELGRTARSRTGPGLGVLIADLDHFKRINDTHGHLIGDQVLCETVRRFGAHTRPYDAVGRLGGEEFLVLLTDCRYEQVVAASERLREAIETTPIETSAGCISLSVSIGTATVDPGDVVSGEVAMATADSALYTAKAAGRNQCCCVRIERDGPSPAWLGRSDVRVLGFAGEPLQ